LLEDQIKGLSICRIKTYCVNPADSVDAILFSDLFKSLLTILDLKRYNQ
jgi:hypothetical protein